MPALFPIQSTLGITFVEAQEQARGRETLYLKLKSVLIHGVDCHRHFVSLLSSSMHSIYHFANLICPTLGRSAVQINPRKSFDK